MPTPQKYTNKDGEITFFIRYYKGINPITNKPVHTTYRGFKSKRDANAYIKKLDFQKMNGTIFDEEISLAESETVTYKDVYGNWIKVYKETVQASTFDKTVTIFKNHILPSLGDSEINKVSLDDCQSFINSLAKGYKSYRKAFNYASLVFDFAEARDVITKNPMNHVIIPKPKVVIESKEQLLFKDNYYEKDELYHFLECAKEHKSNNSFMKYTFFTLIAFSGLRKGEAFALNWGDINFKEKYLSVTKAVAYSKEDKLYLTDPKNKKSRLISLDDETLSILKQWKDMQQNILQLNLESNNEEQLLFMNSSNKLIDPNTAQRWINAIQKKFNLKHVTTHGLRHSHCAYCFKIGMSPREVKDRLGHKDMNVTMNIYDFVNNDARLLAVNKINRDKDNK